MQKFTENLLDNIIRIKNVKNFEELLDIVHEAKVKNIGELSVYDAAVRIGAAIDIKPSEVYLHAGTKKGAEYLLKRKLKEKKLSFSDLPLELRQEFSNADDAETFLCVCKECLNTKTFFSEKCRCLNLPNFPKSTRVC